MGHSEIVIVGGGIIGSSIAYHLALRNVPVVVVDVAEPAMPPSASWASAGGVRQQNRDPREWRLTLEASRRWPALERELGASFEFRQGGHLHIVERDEDVPVLEARVAREQAGGLDVRLVGAAEVQRLAPGITPGARLGAYSPSDGQANPPKTTRAFAAAAAARGVRYRTAARAVELERSGDAVRTVVVDGERLTAAWVVLAAGAWSPRVAEAVGLDLPIAPRAPQMLLTDPGPPVLAPTVSGVGRRLSLKQLPTGEYFIGGGWPSAIDGAGTAAMTCRVVPENVDGSWAVASAVFPPLAPRRVAQSWCGLEGEAIDGVPLIGPASRHRRSVRGDGVFGARVSAVAGGRARGGRRPDRSRGRRAGGTCTLALRAPRRGDGARVQDGSGQPAARLARLTYGTRTGGLSAGLEDRHVHTEVGHVDERE